LIKGDGSILGANNEYGADLGLRMVNGIGGTINAESIEKEGSTFTVRIPLKLQSSH
jgi:signal transduction histidine kinase